MQARLAYVTLLPPFPPCMQTPSLHYTGEVGPDGADVSLRSVGPSSLGDAAGISSAYIPYKCVGEEEKGRRKGKSHKC